MLVAVVIAPVLTGGPIGCPVSPRVCVFFTLTDRASSIPSYIHGFQSDAWSAVQEKIRRTSTKLQREYENKNKNKNKNMTKTTERKEQQTFPPLIEGCSEDLDAFRFFFQHKAHSRKR